MNTTFRITLFVVPALLINGCVCCPAPQTDHASISLPTANQMTDADRASMAKLKSELIVKVEFHQAAIWDIVKFYNTAHLADDKPIDPAIETILVLPEPVRETIPLVTFQATKLSRYDSLRTVADLTGLTFKIKSGRPWLVYEEKHK
mgnify:CR=1 FL=1